MALVKSGIGAVFWPRDAAKSNELQRVATEETPHGIPLLVGLDVIHGHYTIFPTPIAQGSSFDPSVARTDAQISAGEARSGGVNWTFSPMVDVSRDPRWGRVVEGFGEDPYLNAQMGVAKVRGYQGSALHESTSLLACAKHFVAYGQAEGGRDYNTVDLSEQRLRNLYFEPFKSMVDEGVATVMASFNTVSGRPAHANHYLLTDILKSEWGHIGFVVGDAEGIPNLIAHGVASDLQDALKQAFRAGLDMDMGGYVVDVNGSMAVAESDIDGDRVNDAVRRILRLKFALGLFDNPYVQVGDAATEPTALTRRAAHDAAVRSIVLLKNDGTLPLSRTLSKVLLVGPYADSTDHLGAWTQSFAAPAASLAQVLKERLQHSQLTVMEGAVFQGSNSSLQTQACDAAYEHDCVIVAVGEPSKLTGEASSRSDLRLPGDQEALILAIAQTGVPFVVVMSNGRPLVISDWADHAPALLEVWHLGTEAAPAIVDVLFGEANPGGKLPMTFPRSVGQVPIYYNHESTGRPARFSANVISDAPDVGLHGPDNTNDYFTSKYLDLELGPLFSFGHGLSYTHFSVGVPTSNVLCLTRDQLQRGMQFEIAIELKNTGKREGDEVLQLYVRDKVASLAQPMRRLRGFQRVPLKVGQTSVVTFTVGWQDLGFWSDSRPSRYQVEPGEFEVHVGSSLLNTQMLEVSVVL